MTDWMIETLLWTAALIAFVLLVRRPVARAFGPQIAYALWALPALRFALPPLELPSWMRLIPGEAPVAATSAPQELPQELTGAAVSEGLPAGVESALDAQRLGALADGSGPSLTVPSANGDAASGTAPVLTDAPMVDIAAFNYEPLLQLGVAVWLVGAAIFLCLRFSAYFRLRGELLGDGREMGRAGKVRLIETPGTKAPLAFGVIDKVVALPEGFLAHPDRQSRDLALAHELAHHTGRDLLANVLVQPLFAIHWWNPLGRYGWLALRRDQEAACDARVMASAQPQEREVYANLIVSFAAGPNVAPNHALTAPMACPVLGEKSIVHRLRSLKMENTNTGRKVAGRLMLGAAVVALPMTASISYAASEVPEVPEVSIAPPVAPVAPNAPVPPLAPEAPDAPLVDEQIIVIDPDGEVEVSGADTNGDNVFVWKSEGGEDSARVILRSDDGSVRFFDRSEFRSSNRLTKEALEKMLERSEKSLLNARGRGDSVRFYSRSDLDGEGKLSDEQIEEILKDVREGLEEANEALENLPEIIEKAQAEAEEAQAKAEEAQGVAERRTVRVVSTCKSGDDEVVTETQDDDGVQVIRICQKRVMVEALNGLKEARRSIKEADMERGTRSRALREIDRVISRWENEAK